MRLTLSSTVFCTKVQKIMSAMSSKNALPILDCVLLTASKDNTLALMGGDAESVLTDIMDAIVDFDGSIALPAKMLSQALKELSDQPITISTNPNTMEVLIEYANNGRFSMVGQNPDDYPILVEEAADNHAIFKGRELLAGLSAVAVTIANDELRPQMNGVFVDVVTDDGEAFLVSSDGHALSKWRIKVECDEQQFNAIIPAKAVGVLRSIVKADEEVVMQVGKSGVVFVCAGCRLRSKSVEGRYPNYNSVIPTSCTSSPTIERKPLISLLRRMAVFASSSNPLCRLEFVNDNLRVSVKDVDFSQSAEEDMPIENGGEGVVGMNLNMLLGILSSINAKTIEVQYTSKETAVVLRSADEESDSDSLWLIMPLLID